MEQGNREPTQPGLEETLWCVREDQMVQFAADGFRLFELMETGEAHMRSAQAGETEYVFNVPVREPILLCESSSLGGLFDRMNEHDYSYDEGLLATEINTDEFKAWVESLVTPARVKDAAVRELARRETEGDEEATTCANCKGRAGFEIPCSCTYGTVTHTDLTGESESTAPITLRESGTADPGCGTCEGAGTRRAVCITCEGCGQTEKYPHIILKNAETGEQRVLRLDLAQLLANDDITADWTGTELVYYDYEVSNKILRFRVSDYIDRNIAGMGIDQHNAAIAREDGLIKIDSTRANVTARPAFWRKQGDVIQKGDIQDHDQAADETLHLGQEEIARLYGWPYSKVANAEGSVIGTEWLLRPVRPMEETLADMKTALAQHNFTLGYSRSFIATGESGPSFFLLDNDGNVLTQLSGGYFMRESLENAWIAFQQIQGELPK